MFEPPSRNHHFLFICLNLLKRCRLAIKSEYRKYRVANPVFPSQRQGAIFICLVWMISFISFQFIFADEITCISGLLCAENYDDFEGHSLISAPIQWINPKAVRILYVIQKVGQDNQDNLYVKVERGIPVIVTDVNKATQFSKNEAEKYIINQIRKSQRELYISRVGTIRIYAYGDWGYKVYEVGISSL